MSGEIPMTWEDPALTFSPVLHLYTVNTFPGTGTETIPAGATTVDIECWGATGFGGHGNTAGGSEGGGGASGSYSHSQYSVVAHGGQTFTYVVAAAPGFDSSVVNGTYPPAVNMDSPGGGGGGIGTFGADGAGGVAGAIGTGGTITNSKGNDGSAGAGFGSGTGQGGHGVIGVYATGHQGAHGSFSNTTNNPGFDGQVLFYYV